MANMGTIVGAIIAITVRGSRREVYTGNCDRAGKRPGSYDCGVHRFRWRTRRVFCYPGCGHAHGNRGYPHGCSSSYHIQGMILG